MSKGLWTICLLMLFPFCGCSRDSIYDQRRVLENDVWRMGEYCVFDMDLSGDTTNRYNLSVCLRHSDAYPWQRIFIVAQLQDSAQTVLLRDTLSHVLFDPRGQATGRGLSYVRENEIVWKKGYRFPYAGRYRVLISHGMRNVELKGVNSVGLKVEEL